MAPADRWPAHSGPSFTAGLTESDGCDRHVCMVASVPSRGRDLVFTGGRGVSLEGPRDCRDWKAEYNFPRVEKARGTRAIRSNVTREDFLHGTLKDPQVPWWGTGTMLKEHF